MILEHCEKIDQNFNPINISFSEHDSPKLISKLLWEEFLNTSILRCHFHPEHENDKQKKYY